MRLPRMTTRRWMVAVAVAAGGLAAVFEWGKWRERLKLEEVRLRLERPLDRPRYFMNCTPLDDFASYLRTGLSGADRIPIDVTPRAPRIVRGNTCPIALVPEEFGLPIRAILERKLSKLGLVTYYRGGRIVIDVRK